MNVHNDTNTIPVKATVEVTIEQIRGLLCCAFEGGSNYWYADLDIVDAPEGWKALRDAGTYWHWSQFIPTLEGGVISFLDRETLTTHTLDLAKCVKGLTVMAERAPRHLADLQSGNDDADTGDVYLQCCIFGEAIYG